MAASVGTSRCPKRDREEVVCYLFIASPRCTQAWWRASEGSIFLPPWLQVTFLRSQKDISACDGSGNQDACHSSRSQSCWTFTKFKPWSELGGEVLSHGAHRLRRRRLKLRQGVLLRGIAASNCTRLQVGTEGNGKRISRRR